MNEWTPPTPEKLFLDIQAQYAFDDPSRFAAAKRYRLSVYPDLCPAHGDTAFRMKTRQCVECAKTARAMARGRGDASYLERCDDCGGATPHSVQTGGCLWCRKSRAKKETPRAVARRAREPRYLDECDTHGLHEHTTLHGKCLACFNASGTARPGPRVRTPRAAARDEGRKTYFARCEPCGGVTDHHVRSGTCSACYTVTGFKRVRR